MNIENIPFYYAELRSEDCGVFAISLVENPAVEINWFTFSKNEQKQQLFFDEEKHLLTGVVMLADTPIYREMEDGTPYFIVYSKEVIKEMTKKMLNKDRTYDNIDIQHNGKLLEKGKVELIELYIKDTKNGVPTLFSTAKEGSLIATYKVNDPNIWADCKNGTLNGFSLAGWFDLARIENKDIINNFKSKMNFKSMLKKVLLKYSEVKLDDGSVWVLDGELVEGATPLEADGNAVPDGEYTIEDKVYTIKDGSVESIKDVEKVEEPVEEVQAEEEPTEPTEEPTYAVQADVDALSARLADLEAKLADLEAKLAEPVAEPIVEEYAKVTNKNLNGAAKFLAKLK